MLMKLAGGTERHVEWLDAEQFLNQARAYKEGLDQNMTDRFYRFIVNVRATHPFAVERARTLDEWIGSQEYSDILLGNYATPVSVPVKVRLCPTCGWRAGQTDMFCFTDGTPLPPQ
jgi:hypothetical protein